MLRRRSKNDTNDAVFLEQIWEEYALIWDSVVIPSLCYVHSFSYEHITYIIHIITYFYMFLFNFLFCFILFLKRYTEI